ncbi:DUF2515 domain-containing protein [Heyndrickxia vini]|uniref:DUF2515 domain-containing protein n=1 Tax=Heyndrickxia vini TaxID=1476025 RepID=A0ABX7E6V8_9BACI|nr:DUF2515 domain-containing protein [Heyndrickxia vini]QQZ11499.1 DUF2515 domain-containing protein [Heyndrickxia vini]
MFNKQKSKLLSKSLIKIKKELTRNVNIKLLPKEEFIIRRIKEQTYSLNKNNITRTNAYLDFYQRHPEIHWAFLGHMVSRNGGWNMTDLKGSILSKLLSKKEATSFFTFLERGNWLIFQDAYPQFLVYEESKMKGQNLFHLLPHLHVSKFMVAVWNQFWQDKDPYKLAIALIVNEQNYLEKRVINNPLFKKDVFGTIEFKLQDILSMNQILFPYVKNKQLCLSGQTLNHFLNLHERILLGKRLYNILFINRNLLALTENWASSHPHSASRKDYWPQIFNDVNEDTPGRFVKTRLKSCQLLPNSPRFYSPKLEYAWKNQEHQDAELGDWYSNWQVIYYLIDSKEHVDGEIKHEYCKTLERLELAAITKKALSFMD